MYAGWAMKKYGKSLSNKWAKAPNRPLTDEEIDDIIDKLGVEDQDYTQLVYSMLKKGNMSILKGLKNG